MPIKGRVRFRSDKLNRYLHTLHRYTNMVGTYNNMYYGTELRNMNRAVT